MFAGNLSAPTHHREFPKKYSHSFDTQHDLPSFSSPQAVAVRAHHVAAVTIVWKSLRQPRGNHEGFRTIGPCVRWRRALTRRRLHVLVIMFSLSWLKAASLTVKIGFVDLENRWGGSKSSPSSSSFGAGKPSKSTHFQGPTQQAVQLGRQSFLMILGIFSSV